MSTCVSPVPPPHCRLGWGGSVLIANLPSFPEETACFCCSRTLSSELLGLEKLEVADRTGLCLAGGWGAPHPLICRWALRTLGGVRQPARLRLRSCSQACSHLRGALWPELVHFPPSRANYTFWQSRQPGAVSFASPSLFSACRCHIITGPEGSSLGAGGRRGGLPALHVPFLSAAATNDPAPVSPVSIAGMKGDP